VNFEIGQIDQLLKSYTDILYRVQEDTPDLVELTALASVLHSFYNGLEKIFLVIAKKVDKNVPKDTPAKVNQRAGSDIHVQTQ